MKTKRKNSHSSYIPGNRASTYWLYLIPGISLVVVVVVIPFFWNVYLTFTSYRGIKPPEWIGFKNWNQLFQDKLFWESFINSFVMILAMVVIPTLIGLLIASTLFDVIARKFNAKIASFLRATYYLPQILPAVVASIVIGWILRPENGALNYILASIGLDDLQRNWLGDPNTALSSIVVILIWIQIGYPVVIFMAAMQRVDPELYEAAELDGANWFQRFTAVTVGIIRPEIFVVVLTCTIAALKVFGPVYTLTRGGPGASTTVPAYYAYSEFFQSQQVGYGATIATALTVVIIVFSVVFLLLQNRAEKKENE